MSEGKTTIIKKHGAAQRVDTLQASWVETTEVSADGGNSPARDLLLRGWVKQDEDKPIAKMLICEEDAKALYDDLNDRFGK